jgi:pimeloyl-ACP methyl ester carboxylesterase
MRPRLLLAVPAILIAVAASYAPPAQAATAYAPCSPAGFECAGLDVPLDPAGGTAGTISLSIKRVVSSDNPTRTAVVALAGGPGQAAIPAARDFAEILAPALASRDLVVFDQRGTGESSRLRCAAFDRGSGSIAEAARSCAAEIGPRRAYFRTTESVADIEAIRRESGYERLVLFGVSYGTKVALDYAALHPERVESLVLDSVVPPEGSDVLNGSSLRAVGPALRELCGGGRCDGITGDPRGDVAALVRRLEARRIEGPVTLPGGDGARLALDAGALFGIVLAGDLDPTLRAELPAAVRSALRGDVRPILRLQLRASGLTPIPDAVALQGEGGDSEALLVATRCEESIFPWDRAAGPAQRAAQARRAVRAIPRARFGAFSGRVALDSDVIPVCVGWPNAAPPPAAPGAPPAVPTLIISGGADVRTPPADARAIAARIPTATLLHVPFAGHSVLGSDASDCASAAVAAFFGGLPVERCAGSGALFAPAPIAPTSLDRVRGADRVRRTIAAVRATVADVDRQFVGGAVAAGRAPRAGERVGGLRSGSAVWTRSGVRLQRVVYVPGVIVSGFDPRAAGATTRLLVSGTGGARGSVRLLAGGRVDAVLDGRPVRIGSMRAEAAVAGPAWGRRFPRHPRVVGLG